jgi:hypothetical protein
MTVVNVYTGQPKPGRYEEALEMNRASKKVLESHGARNPRILVAAVSGAAYGAIVNVCELDDFEAWGAFYDRIMQDDQILAMIAQVQGDNTPYATQSTGVATEIPLGRQRGSNGNVVAALVSAPVPGRFQAGIALGHQAFDVAERHGARNCRLFQQQANGLQPDVLIATMDFDNMAAYGRMANAFLSEPSVQPILELLQSSDSPIRPITTEIYTEIAG